MQSVTDMDGAHFQKLCRDCGLVDKHTGITEIDLVFTSVSWHSTLLLLIDPTAGQPLR